MTVTGRVTDAEGRPVAGRIFYHWANDNPHVREYPDLPRARLRMSDWGVLDREGRFRLLAIPGRGAVGVCATPEFAFPRLDTPRELDALGVRSHPVAALHAVAAVDVDATKPGTTARDFTLAVGRSRTLTVAWPAGKSAGTVLAVGQSGTADGTPLTGGTLRLTGLSPDRARAVVLFDEARTVGAVAAVTGDKDTPVAVTLEKLGSVKGRVLDPTGAPAAGARVRLWLVLDPAKFDNLPTEAFGVNGNNYFAPGAWQAFTGRAVNTDREGRFEIPGLLPGQAYRLVAGYDVEERGGEVLHQRSGVSVKAGERHDLGDLREKQ